MGKTYRRTKGAYKHNGEFNYERRVRQPEHITSEWAMKMTKYRIKHALNELVKKEVIKPYDVEDYFWIITERVVDVVDKYDPDRRNEDGRTASAMNYLFTTVDNTLANIIEKERRLACSQDKIPICKLPPGEASKVGYISEDDMRFSDGCRSMKILELHMDVHTLAGMLTVDELQVLRLLLDGYGVSELSRRLGLSQMTVIRRLIPAIQRKARYCGFHSRSDIRKGV